MKQMEISWPRPMSWPMTVLPGRVHLLLISKLSGLSGYSLKCDRTNVGMILYFLGRNMP